MFPVEEDDILFIRLLSYSYNILATVRLYY